MQAPLSLFPAIPLLVFVSISILRALVFVGPCMQLEVLRTMDWSIPVLVWSVELDGSNRVKDEAVRDLLLSKGYAPYTRKSINQFFVRPRARARARVQVQQVRAAVRAATSLRRWAFEQVAVIKYRGRKPRGLAEMCFVSTEVYSIISILSYSTAHEYAVVCCACARGGHTASLLPPPHSMQRVRRLPWRQIPPSHHQGTPRTGTSPARAGRSGSQRTPCTCSSAARAGRCLSRRTPCTGAAAGRAGRRWRHRTPCTRSAAARAGRRSRRRTPRSGGAPARAGTRSRRRTPRSASAACRAGRAFWHADGLSRLALVADPRTA